MSVNSNIKQGVTNLIKYFHVVWNDRHWDGDYIYLLLHRKLELKEKFFRSDNTHTLNSDETADEIKLVKEALNRLIEDDYLTEETKEYDEKYGHLDILIFKEAEGKNYSRRVETRPEEAVKVFREACDRANKREDTDRKFVFNYMIDHIEGWWD